MKTFTFKNNIRTGKFRSFESDSCEIKLNGFMVGSIAEIRSYNQHLDNGKFSISFMINKIDLMEDGNPNCPWRWIKINYRGESLKDAKSFVKAFSKNIQEKYNLRLDTNK